MTRESGVRTPPNGNRAPKAFVLAELAKHRAADRLLGPRFIWWLLAEELPPRVLRHPNCAAALAGVAELYHGWIDSGEPPGRDRWAPARDAAAYAANAAAYGVAAHHANAPVPATVYATATAAAYAAYAAANVVGQAVGNVACAAANVAAYAACANANANAATYAACANHARSQYWLRASDKLIALLSNTPC